MTIEKSNDEDICKHYAVSNLDATCDVLKSLYINRIFTKQQLRRGLDRLYMDTENIVEDVPTLHESLAKIILKLVQENVLASQVLLKIPTHDREEIVKYEPFATHFAEELKVFAHEDTIKHKFYELTTAYLENFDSAEIIDYLKTMPYHEIVRPWFLRNSILLSLDRGNVEREKISQLHKELAKEFGLTFVVFSFTYDFLIQTCHDYMLDVPHYVDFISMFLARAIYDGCFNAMYILHAETFDSSDSNQLKILKAACSYLSLDPSDDHLKNIWGSAISNEALGEKFNEYIQAYNENQNEAEMFNKLKDLECPFYFHEFVKRLVLFYTKEEQDDGNYEHVLKLLKYLVSNLLLTKSQFEVGVKNARHDIAVLSQSDQKVSQEFKKLQDECLSRIKFSKS